MDALSLHNSCTVEKRILRLLKLLHHSTHWFRNGYPVIQLPYVLFHLNNGIIEYQKYISINKKTSCDLLAVYLSNFKVEHTNLNYPFLLFSDFIWKEDIFYSSNIEIKYIKAENPATMGPKKCKRCKKYYMKEFKLLLKFCSTCHHTMNVNIRKNEINCKLTI